MLSEEETPPPRWRRRHHCWVYTAHYSGDLSCMASYHLWNIFHILWASPLRALASQEKTQKTHSTPHHPWQLGCKRITLVPASTCTHVRFQFTAWGNRLNVEHLPSQYTEWQWESAENLGSWESCFTGGAAEVAIKSGAWHLEHFERSWVPGTWRLACDSSDSEGSHTGKSYSMLQGLDVVPADFTW